MLHQIHVIPVKIKREYGRAYLGAFAQFWKVTLSFFMSVDTSVCLHSTALLQLDGFS